MHRLLHQVPRLQALAVFESAARLGSFTAAAAELGMTQPAVSRRIADLERTVGFALFERTPNRVRPTVEGRALLATVQDGFERVSERIERLGAEQATFVLAANPGFAQRWLVPHLEALQATLGELDLRLRLFDREAELDDRYDAAAHLTALRTAPAASIVLFAEVVVPVASPTMAARHGLDQRSSPELLGTVPLLELDDRDRRWMTWSDWFAGCGDRERHRASRLSYNNYALVVSDAIAGRGVALGWRGLVDDALAAGTLVEVGPEVTNPDNAYLLMPGPRVDADAFEALTGWLVRHVS